MRALLGLFRLLSISGISYSGISSTASLCLFRLKEMGKIRVKGSSRCGVDQLHICAITCVSLRGQPLHCTRYLTAAVPHATGA